MSFISDHTIKGFEVLQPPAYTFTTAVAFNLVSSVTVTPGSVPVAGQLIIIVICANPGGAYNVTPAAGFTEVVLANPSAQRIMKIYYKVATGSEPASYVFPLGVGNCVGHWRIYYLNNITPPLVVVTDSLRTGGGPGTFPVVEVPYQVFNYSFVIICGVPSSGGATDINCDNSFVHGTTGHSAGSKIWVRAYNATARDEITNIISPTVAVLLPRFTVINANRMY